jgi:hypothetical protein
VPRNDKERPQFYPPTSARLRCLRLDQCLVCYITNFTKEAEERRPCSRADKSKLRYGSFQCSVPDGLAEIDSTSLLVMDKYSIKVV